MGLNYYALVAGLPDILLEDKKVTFSSIDLRNMLEEEVSSSDYDLVELLYMPFDHINLLNLFFNTEKEFDKRGNYPLERMEKFKDKKNYEIADIEEVPEYFAEFLECIHGENECIESYYEAERKLNESYYNYLQNLPNDFMQELARYELNIGNLMTALNGRKYKIDIEDKLIGHDEVTSALKKRRSRDFGLGNEIDDIEQLIQIFENDRLLEREFKIDLHKWHYLDEMTFFNYFTIEKVLAFIQKLFMVERWLQLDEEKGREMFNQLLEDLQSEFQFPEEFTLAYGKK
ncbi:MAG: DUF2764 domain-containing protein [Prolixibacteraceae bacterium]|nr:DUF2764 domain-containing protein [Prolixibacteraceae bacterium]